MTLQEMADTLFWRPVYCKPVKAAPNTDPKDEGQSDMLMDVHPAGLPRILGAVVTSSFSNPVRMNHAYNLFNLHTRLARVAGQARPLHCRLRLQAIGRRIHLRPEPAHQQLEKQENDRHDDQERTDGCDHRLHVHDQAVPDPYRQRLRIQAGQEQRDQQFVE